MTGTSSDRQPASDRQHGRELDIVVYGATGFVGKLLADYLVKHAPAGIKIGLGGRSLEKLAAVRASLGAAAAELPLIVADAEDSTALKSLAERTRVVATTVGPYAKFGHALVHVCAAAGTHYVDLTGEVLFHRDSIDANHELAISTGARIVHSCGFDSIPSDLGVHVLHSLIQADNAGEMTDTTLVVTSLRGGVSGGTIDSVRNQIDTSKHDARARKLVTSPYSLSPDLEREPDLGRQSDIVVVDGHKIDPSLNGWKAPFFMAVYNTRVVRRSNALREWAYGKTFKYSEVMSVGSSVASPVIASGVAVGLGALVAGLAIPPTRFLLDKVLPAPGEGPNEDAQKKGHFTVDVFTKTTTGARYTSRVRAQGDPGYSATAVMLGESALSLVVGNAELPENAALPHAAGVLTPATALGDVLVERLRRANFEISASRM